MESHRETTPAPSPDTHARSPLRGDLEHMVLREGRGTLSWGVDVAAKAVMMSRVRAVILFRFSQWLARHRLLPIAYWVQSRIIRGAGTEISPLATVGPGLCIMHSVGIVVGPDVTIGRNLRIYQGVTLGDGGRPGQPRLGDDVTVGANALVLGGVTIGDRVVIGANAVVTKDVPSDTVATGMPATFRRRSDAATPVGDGVRHASVDLGSAPVDLTGPEPYSLFEPDAGRRP